MENIFKGISNWIIFIRERFPLNEHIPFILVFFSCCYLVGNNLNYGYFYFNVINLSVSLITVILIFLHLRIFDEIKDLDKDRIIHPNRPLVRGLIKLKHAKIFVTIIILIEILLNSFFNLKAIISLILVISYSFLMYKEFFVKFWITKKVVLYAFLHAIIMILIPIYIYLANFSELKFEYLLFSVCNWFISNIFEFSRKMFLDNEEGFEDSYLNQIGYKKTLTIHYILIFTTLYITLFFTFTNLINIFSFSIFCFTYFLVLSVLTKKEVINYQSKKNNIIKLSKKTGYLVIILFYGIIILTSVVKLI